MKYLIVEPKVAVREKAPNIALMKWARWAEMNGHEYTYVKGCVKLHGGDYVHADEYYPDVILISMIFTYFYDSYEKTIDFYYNKYPNAQIKVGGVFPSLFPEWFDKQKWNGVIDVHKGMCCEIEELSPKYDIDIIYEDEKSIFDMRSIVMYASRGCVNKCAYCAVPRLEGQMNSFKSIKNALEIGKREIPDARVVVLYDNNFTEHEYFDDIVSELVEADLPVDIHGLHVESFDEHKAEQFARLKWGSQGSKNGTSYLRFSFDKLKYADNVERALKLVKDANIKASFFAYMLFNFNDTPEDFWWRIMRTQDMVDRVEKTVFLFPQRYVPFKPVKKNSFIGKHWDEELLRGLKRIYTDGLHNFLPVTRSRNLYNYIGNTYDEFIEIIRETGRKEIEEEKFTGLTREEIESFF